MSMYRHVCSTLPCGVAAYVESAQYMGLEYIPRSRAANNPFEPVLDCARRKLIYKSKEVLIRKGVDTCGYLPRSNLSPVIVKRSTTNPSLRVNTEISRFIHSRII